jgi:hypothetical protein
MPKYAHNHAMTPAEFEHLILTTTLVDLRSRLAARTDGDGNARKGYKGNVAALKLTIEQYETRLQTLVNEGTVA